MPTSGLLTIQSRVRRKIGGVNFNIKCPAWGEEVVELIPVWVYGESLSVPRSVVCPLNKNSFRMPTGSSADSSSYSTASQSEWTWYDYETIPEAAHGEQRLQNRKWWICCYELRSQPGRKVSYDPLQSVCRVAKNKSGCLVENKRNSEVMKWLTTTFWKWSRRIWTLYVVGLN